MFVKKSNYTRVVQENASLKEQLKQLGEKAVLLERELISNDEIWGNNDIVFDRVLNTIDCLEQIRRAAVLEKRKLKREIAKFISFFNIAEVEDDLPIDKTILFRKFTEMPEHRDNSILFRKFDAEQPKIKGCLQCPKYKYSIFCQTRVNTYPCPHDGTKSCCGRAGKFPAHVEFKINGRS